MHLLLPIVPKPVHPLRRLWPLLCGVLLGGLALWPLLTDPRPAPAPGPGPADAGAPQDLTPTPADRSCARLRLLHGRTLLPATVAMLLTADDCQGRPLTNLTASDFVIHEDKEPLPEDSEPVLLPAPGLQVRVYLVLDPGAPAPLQLAAARLAGAALEGQKRPTKVALLAAGPRRAPLKELIAPSADPALPSWIERKVEQRLGRRSAAAPDGEDGAGADVQAALLAALQRAEEDGRALADPNFAGALPLSYVVLLSRRGTGQPGMSRVLTALGQSPAQVLALGLAREDGPDPDAGALRRLASAGFLEAQSAAELPAAAQALGEQLLALTDRTYLLALCSTQRAGGHQLSVSLSGAQVRERASFSYDASGMGEGCSAAALHGACHRRECGGLLCGGCDPRSGMCDGARCQSLCAVQQRCDGRPFQNLWGETQRCAPATQHPDDSDDERAQHCGPRCVDTTQDPAHCGSCGHRCPEGMGCDQGVCAQRRLTRVSSSESYSCALYTDGTVRCWGSARFGQTAGSSAERPIAGLRGVAQIATGREHACARLYDGTLRCWGLNSFGQTGHPTSDEGPAAAPGGPVPGLGNVMDVAAGGAHSCALTRDGLVYCFGLNSDGQTGGGTLTSPVPGVSGAVQVVAGLSHSCARLVDGTVRCWGKDWDGRTKSGDSPQPIEGLRGVVDLAAGGDHSCALLHDGTVRCWGKDWDGQCGGSSPTEPVPGLYGATQLSAGYAHSCAVVADGQVRCWGRTRDGQTAGGTATRGIPSLTGVQQISCGSAHSCALMNDHTVRCWGQNLQGQTGGSNLGTALPGL